MIVGTGGAHASAANSTASNGVSSGILGTSVDVASGGFGGVSTGNESWIGGASGNGNPGSTGGYGGGEAGVATATAAGPDVAGFSAVSGVDATLWPSTGNENYVLGAGGAALPATGATAVDYGQGGAGYITGTPSGPENGANGLVVIRFAALQSAPRAPSTPASPPRLVMVRP